MVDKSNFDWKKYLTDCMQSTEYCCIATVDPKGVWSNPVYFSWDDNFNFYFISQMHSRHMQNIQKNQRISAAIYKTEQKGDIAGIQLEGTAKILTETDSKKKYNTLMTLIMAELDMEQMYKAI